MSKEAAILGYCVITGKRKKRITKYFRDVSIPEEYKFEDEEDIPVIVEK